MIKNFFKNLYNSVIFKRIVSLTLCFFIAVFLWFASVPCKVRADVFSAVALGTSALGALVSAYLATAGVQFSGSSDTDGNFLGNYVANWVKNSPSYASNPYFDSEGNFVGSSDDVSVVQNNDTNVVSLIFGKGFAVWLEALKQLFVSDKSLSAGQTNIFTSDHGFLYDGDYTNVYTQPFQYSPSYQDLTTYSFYSYHFSSSQTYYHEVELSDNLRFELVDTGRYFDVYFYDGSQQVLSTRHVDGRYASGHDLYLFMYIRDNSSTLNVDFYYTEYNPTIADYNVSNNLGTLSLLNYQNYATLSGMSLDGTLTDGYEDFEEAINQDLTNADEENVAVVDVGTFPDSLTADQIADIILDRIIAEELNPTYEGIRENMKDAEEEQEGEKPFVPQYPSDWVVINGLQNFFPFCIPWDLAFVFNLLQAEPEAPRFTWQMNFGKYAEPYDLVIDFSRFETVAVVFRTMMVVLFLFFLIKKTRGLIRG